MKGKVQTIKLVDKDLSLCYNLAMKCKCDFCGKTFNQKPVHIKNNRYNFCCHLHFSEHRKSKKLLSGSKHPNWKGGKWTHRLGYIYVYAPSHPSSGKQGYVLKHRLAMEKRLKRYLTKKERVHHINGNTRDNRIKNLQLFANACVHTWHHRRLKLNIDKSTV